MWLFQFSYSIVYYSISSLLQYTTQFVVIFTIVLMVYRRFKVKLLPGIELGIRTNN